MNYINMVDISKNLWKNVLEIIVDNIEIMWLKEKHIQEGLHHKKLQVTTVKYLSDYRKHRYELVDGTKTI